MFPLHKKSCSSIFFFGCRSASSAKENHSTCRIWIYTGKNDLAAWFICSQVFLSHHPRMSSAASGPVHQDEYGRPDPMALGLSFNESGRKERFDLSFLVLFSLHNSPIYTSHIIHSIHSFIRPTSPLPSLERARATPALHWRGKRTRTRAPWRCKTSSACSARRSMQGPQETWWFNGRANATRFGANKAALQRTQKFPRKPRSKNVYYNISVYTYYRLDRLG